MTYDRAPIRTTRRTGRAATSDDDTQVVQPALPAHPPTGTGSSAASGLRAPGSRSSTRSLRAPPPRPLGRRPPSNVNVSDTGTGSPQGRARSTTRGGSCPCCSGSCSRS